LDDDAYPMLYRFLARARAGDDAAAELAAHAAQLKNKAWPYPLIELFLGERSPEDAVAAAAEQPQAHIEALFHVAQWHLLRSDLGAAKARLRAVAARCPRQQPEYAIARAELGRLRLRQSWPGSLGA